MNVFAGTTEQFLAFTQGSWGPSVGDYLATSSAINLTATYDIAEPDSPVVLAVTATRATNGAAAVSGELTLTSGGAAIAGATVVYAGVGKWIVTLPPREMGTVWNLGFSFTDPWNFYAATTSELVIPVPSTP